MSDNAVSAGRGVLYIAFAKLWFMVAGVVLELLVLPRVVSASTFGAYKLVNGVASILNGVMIAGTVQAISRYTTENPERAAQIRGAGFRMHLFVGLPIALAFCAGSPLIAYFEHDMSKAGLHALSAAIVAIYAFYSVLVGSANGQRHFHKQAGLDVTASTLRAGAILTAAVIGLGVWGMIAGWVAAAAAVFLIAAVWVGLPRGVAHDRVKPMFLFLVGLAGYLILMQLVMTADNVVLKRLAAAWYHGQGLTDALAAVEADKQVGYYAAVQNVARLPYQLMLTATFIVFPLVSRATFEGDVEKTRSYIRTTMRYSLVFAAAMGFAVSASPRVVLGLLYPAEYAVGSDALALLAAGNVAFAIFTISGTILNAAGRTRDASITAVITLVLLVVALFVVVPRTAPGRDMLVASAACTAGAMGLGTLIAAILVYRRFGAFLPWLTIVRVAAAAGAALAVGRFLDLKGTLAIGEVAAAAAVFLIVCIVTGELGPKDLRALRRKG